MPKSDVRVLIAEDEPTNLELVQEVLRAKQITPLPAPDGEQALDMAKKHLPDLILMDLRMPKRHGISVTRALKEDETTRDIPIIALTASVMDSTEEEALKAGCNGYIKKPINVSDLTAEISKYLRTDEKT